MSSFHTGVLIKEVIQSLNIKEGEKYIDATLGGGDYTAEILLNGGIVLGIDQDEAALQYCQKRFREELIQKRLFLALDNFQNIKTTSFCNNFKNISGIVFDLGISSYQLDDPTRGFSFKHDLSPLDMRMSRKLNVKAFDLLNALNKKQLEIIFYKYGQVREGKILAEKVIEGRNIKKILTVGDFMSILRAVKNDSFLDDFCAKVFMSLRIAVNSELDVLHKSFSDAADLLYPRGRLAIVSFQSLEDSIVKDLNKNSNLIAITRKPLIPSKAEIYLNQRSRSAKLRVYEKK